MIESDIQERETIPIRTFGPGEDLAWAWLFPPYYMHFSARAIEPTRAIFFYGTRLREQCEANHELGYQLMKRIAESVVQNLNATQKRLLVHCNTEIGYGMHYAIFGLSEIEAKPIGAC